MQLIVEKEILIVVASLVVHCCAIKKGVIVASQFYNVADVQFTIEKEGLLGTFAVYSNVKPLELCFKFTNNVANFPHNCR